MSLVPKNATIQVRVVPIVKQSSEEVLWRIGLTMSQAVELFLRRVIVEERLPFDVVALQSSQVGELDRSLIKRGVAPEHKESAVDGEKLGAPQKGGRPKKELKTIFGRRRTPSRIRAKRASKKRGI